MGQKIKTHRECKYWKGYLFSCQIFLITFTYLLNLILTTLCSCFGYDLALPYVETHFQTPVITSHLSLN